MISTDFVSNEKKDDAILSLKLIFQPWRWKNGKSVEKARQVIKRKFFRKNDSIHLFLSGRSAIYYCLKQLNLPVGSEVIVQAFTCSAVIFPILENKLKPIYVDIDRKTLSTNPTNIEEKITPKTKVLIFQHTFGFTPDRENIIKIAKEHNLIVIEDVAHGFEPSLFKNDTHDTIKILSFGRSKPFSSVFGGALVTSDTNLSKRIGKLDKKLLPPSNAYILSLLLYKPLGLLIQSTYSIIIGKVIHKIVDFLHILPREISKKEKECKFDHTLARSYPNALALLLLKQLDKYNQTVKIRSESVKEYSSFFEGKDCVKALFNTNQPLIRFPVLVDNKKIILNQARKYNVFLGSWYNQPVDPKDINLFKVEYHKGSCPVAEEICEQVVNLPTTVSAKQRKKVLDILKKTYDVSLEISQQKEKNE